MLSYYVTPGGMYAMPTSPVQPLGAPLPPLPFAVPPPLASFGGGRGSAAPSPTGGSQAQGWQQAQQWAQPWMQAPAYAAGVGWQPNALCPQIPGGSMQAWSDWQPGPPQQQQQQPPSFFWDGSVAMGVAGRGAGTHSPADELVARAAADAVPAPQEAAAGSSHPDDGEATGGSRRPSRVSSSSESGATTATSVDREASLTGGSEASATPPAALPGPLSPGSEASGQQETGGGSSRGDTDAAEPPAGGAGAATDDMQHLSLG